MNFHLTSINDSELMMVVKKMNKAAVKALVDAARDVVQGSSYQGLDRIAERVLYAVEAQHPQWLA